MRATAAPRFCGLRHDQPRDLGASLIRHLSASIVVVTTTCAERSGEGARSGYCYAGRRPSSQVDTVVATGPCASPSCWSSPRSSSRPHRSTILP